LLAPLAKQLSKGVYHHWESYPNEGLGQFLIHILTGHFQNDLARMLCFLIDENPAGWSTIHAERCIKATFVARECDCPSAPVKAALLAFIGAKRRALTGEAGGSGAGFSQEGQPAQRTVEERVFYVG
jgi:hypothetical protein